MAMNEKAKLRTLSDALKRLISDSEFEMGRWAESIAEEMCKDDIDREDLSRHIAGYKHHKGYIQALEEVRKIIEDPTECYS